MKLLDTFAAWLDLKAAELRTGTTLIEAVALDAQMLDLRRVGDFAELLDTAIIAGKLGLLPDDIEPMSAVYYTARARGITDSDIRDMGNIIGRHILAHDYEGDTL